MQLNTLLLIAASSITVLSAGFYIPEGQPHGVYSVYEDANGTMVYTRLPDPPVALTGRSFATPVNGKFRRSPASIKVDCGNIHLNERDTDEANRQLDAQCNGNNPTKAHMSFYSISHAVVTYFCNQAAHKDTCYASDRQDTSRMITARCGRYQAGWTYDDGGH
jgi:hypothetical protein